MNPWRILLKLELESLRRSQNMNFDYLRSLYYLPWPMRGIIHFLLYLKCLEFHYVIISENKNGKGVYLSYFPV